MSGFRSADRHTRAAMKRLAEAQHSFQLAADREGMGENYEWSRAQDALTEATNRALNALYVDPALDESQRPTPEAGG